MEVLVPSSAVRGYHVYKDIWKPSIGEKLYTKKNSPWLFSNLRENEYIQRMNSC